MPYVPAKKGTLWIPSGNGNVKHLFFIVSNKCAEGCHLIVNMTSIREHVPPDPACLLNVGDHPAVQQPSYIIYNMAEVQAADRLTKLVELNYYSAGQDASDELIERILEGAYESEFIKRHIQKYLDGL